ncbi:protein of unknown function [Paraburkholderia kururiensis]
MMFVSAWEAAVKKLVNNSALYRKITAVEGVGSLTASAVVGTIRHANSSPTAVTWPGSTPILLRWQSPVTCFEPWDT